MRTRGKKEGRTREKGAFRDTFEEDSDAGKTPSYFFLLLFLIKKTYSFLSLYPFKGLFGFINCWRTKKK